MPVISTRRYSSTSGGSYLSTTGTTSTASSYRNCFRPLSSVSPTRPTTDTTSSYYHQHRSSTQTTTNDSVSGRLHVGVSRYPRQSIDRDILGKPPPSGGSYGSSSAAATRYSRSNYNESKSYTPSSLYRSSSPYSTRSASALVRSVATSGVDLYEKYSPAHYIPKCELSRSRSLSESTTAATGTGASHTPATPGLGTSLSTSAFSARDRDNNFDGTSPSRTTSTAIANKVKQFEQTINNNAFATTNTPATANHSTNKVTGQTRLTLKPTTNSGIQPKSVCPTSNNNNTASPKPSQPIAGQNLNGDCRSVKKTTLNAFTPTHLHQHKSTTGCPKTQEPRLSTMTITKSHPVTFSKKFNVEPICSHRNKDFLSGECELARRQLIRSTEAISSATQSDDVSELRADNNNLPTIYRKSNIIGPLVHSTGSLNSIHKLNNNPSGKRLTGDMNSFEDIKFIDSDENERCKTTMPAKTVDTKCQSLAATLPMIGKKNGETSKYNTFSGGKKETPVKSLVNGAGETASPKNLRNGHRITEAEDSTRSSALRNSGSTASTSGRSWDREGRSSIANRTLSDSDAYSRSNSVTDGGYSRNGTTQDDGTEGLCGLRNIGNTCFMNSVIQCLSHTSELLDFLRKKTSGTNTASKDQRILHEFCKLIREMWTTTSRSVTPSELKSAFSSKHRMYSGCGQQDAQEFLRFFLDSLHSALNNGAKGERLEIDDSLSDNKKADLTWEWYAKIENSVVRDLFVGQLKSTLKCTVCGNTSVTFDPFWDLSVPLPSSSRCKLEACLDSFIREEVLDGDEMPTCAKCQKRRKCTKTFTIQRFPKYLVIHLKRFSETRWSKMSNIVEFPTDENDLNMGPYASNSSSAVRYSLYGVSNHMGSTAGGHYVALCKHPTTKRWHEFNDNIVSDASENSLVSSSAYLLFYERAGTFFQTHSQHRHLKDVRSINAKSMPLSPIVTRCATGGGRSATAGVHLTRSNANSVAGDFWLNTVIGICFYATCLVLYYYFFK